MDKLFDRLGNMLNTMFSNLAENLPFSQRDKRETYTDPLMQDAWDELNDYLNNRERTKQDKRKRSGSRSRENQYGKGEPGDDLKEDYANLEVPFGSSFEAVKKAYKKLLRAYHPDRHADNHEKQKLATEITKKINASFSRIKAYEHSRAKRG